MTQVLVIEDEAPLREEIIDILTFEGFTTHSATDGMEGIRMAEQVGPDMIICDVMMPGMDGYEVLEHLRGQEAFVNTQFLFLTARATRSDMRRGMTLGADDYIPKPFTRTELLDAVRTRLERQESQAAAQDERLQKARQAFLSMVNHELRTPVSTLTLSTQMLSDRVPEAMSDELGHLVKIANSGSERIGLLVERMTMFLNTELDTLTEEGVRFMETTEPVDAVIEGALELAKTLAFHQDEPAYFEIDTATPHQLISGNHKYIRYAIAEVISNAIKFSPPKEPVAISQWMIGGYVAIRVADRGMSFQKEQLEQIVEPFIQHDREKQEQQGLGIGLTLATRIINAHGGLLTITPDPGAGTEVIICLPVTA